MSIFKLADMDRHLAIDRTSTTTPCVRLRSCFFTFALVTISLTLMGCVGMSVNECMYTDWRTKGEFDGRDGAPAEKFSQYEKQCMKHSVNPDRTAYEEGRNEGLKQFCVQEVGFVVGAEGKSYHNVCSAALEPDFLLGYRDGYSLYRAASAVTTVESRIFGDEQRINRLEHEIEEFRKQMLDEELTNEERDGLLYKIRKRSREIGEALQSIRTSERELVDVKVNLRLVERDLEDKGYQITRRGWTS